MNKRERPLDELFQSAKSQEPKLSFDEVSKRFSTSISGGGITKWSNGIFKNIINKTSLFITSTAVLIGTTVFLSYNTNNQNLNKETITDVYSDNTKIILAQGNEPKIELEDRKVADQVKDGPKEKPRNTNDDKRKQIDTFLISLDTDTLTNNMNSGTKITFRDLPQSFFTETADLFEIENSQKVEEKISATQKSNPEERDLILNSDSDQSKVDSTEKVFTLNEYSTESDFRRVYELAKKAGIDYWYRVHHQKKRKTKELFLVRDFKITMSIPGTDIASNIIVNVAREGSFKVKFGWTTDYNGQAIDLSESILIDESK